MELLGPLLGPLGPVELQGVMLGPVDPLGPQLGPLLGRLHLLTIGLTVDHCIILSGLCLVYRMRNRLRTHCQHP